MSYVHPFYGYTPPPRRDEPWIGVVPHQATTATGTGAITLATIPFGTPDPDPSRPAARDFTVEDATLPEAWFQFEFVDVDGGLSSPSEWVLSPAPESVIGPASLPPTPAQLRSRSKLLTERTPPPTGSNPDPLEEVMLTAMALVEGTTCRLLDPATTTCSNCEPVPDYLIPAALRAVVLKAEAMVVGDDPVLVAQIAAGRRLRGFTAGPYSESYFSPSELVWKHGRPQVDPNPALDEVLWLLMTEDCREQFIAWATGIQVPAGAFSEFDYRREAGGFYPTYRSPGWIMPGW